MKSSVLGKPLAVDLFCGKGGWTRSFLAKGYRVLGVDIERHEDYPGEFIQADVRTLNGADFRGAAQSASRLMKETALRRRNV